MLLIVSPLRRNWLGKDTENGRVGLGADVVARLEDYRGPMLTAEVVGSMAGYNAKIDQNGSMEDWNCNEPHGPATSSVSTYHLEALGAMQGNQFHASASIPGLWAYNR